MGHGTMTGLFMVFESRLTYPRRRIKTWLT